MATNLDRQNFRDQVFDKLPKKVVCSNFHNCTFNAATTFERCNLIGCTFNKVSQFDRSNVMEEEDLPENRFDHEEGEEEILH